jgi:hypothetical protein
MVLSKSRLRHFSRIVSAVCLLALFGPAPACAADDEPIAYIGHGGFFDSKGNQIPVTPEFVAKAQAYYRAKLLSRLGAAKQGEFSSFEKPLNDGAKAQGQAQLVLQQRSLDWLIANSPTEIDGRTMGKLNALKHQLQWKLPEKADLKEIPKREEFRLDPELNKKLKLPQLGPDPTVLSATMNKGQAYLNECMNAGVPIPPPIGVLDPAGLTGWKSQGFIPTASQFIVGTPAEVRTYHSTAPAPEGLCISLPRYADATLTTVGLDGVICLGKVSSKVCIWDNQMNGQGFPFDITNTKIPIGVPDLSINPAGQYQAGGFELDGGSGGVCTDCHAGQNPYIIHPDLDLGGGVLMGSLNLPTFSLTRYDPLVPADWPQNALSMSPALVPSACIGCHHAGGIGGAFPHLSTELSAGYCNTILAQALTKTMPQGNPGSAVNDPDVITFQNWCGQPISAGPSNRGDPHLTTTNGVLYDFQAMGEFTALRNSATHFELQTRQTPVSTTFVPGASPYTGLQSCVSLNTAAALRIGKHRVTYQPGIGKAKTDQRFELRIDGKVEPVPANGINFGGGDRIATTATGGGIDITTSEGTHVIITPNFWSSQGYWYLNVEVLNTPAREGTMGAILPSNWLPLAPNGKSFGPKPVSVADRYKLLDQIFADAWRVTKTTSLFDYGPGLSTADFTDRNWPEDEPKNCKAPNNPKPPPKPMSAEAARRLCTAIKDRAAFASCLFDLTATGDTGMLKAYLLTLKLRQDAGPAGRGHLAGSSADQVP